MTSWYSSSIAIGGTNYLGFFDGITGKRKNVNISNHYTNLYGMRYIPPFLALGYDSNIVLIDLKTRKKVLDSSLPSSYIWGIDRLTPNRFITSGGTGHVSLWSMKERLSQFVGHTQCSRECASVVSSRGEYFSSVGNDGKIVIYNSRKSKIERSINISGNLYGVMEDYIRRRIYFSSYASGFIYQYDLRTKPVLNNIPSLKVSTNLWSLYVSSEEQKIYACDNAGSVHLVDPRKGYSSSGKYVLKTKKHHLSVIYRIRRLSSRYMVTCCASRKCVVFDKDTLKEKLNLVTSSQAIYGMETIPRNNQWIYRREIGFSGDGGLYNLSSGERYRYLNELNRLRTFEKYSNSSQTLKSNQVTVITNNDIRIPLWKCFLLSSSKKEADLKKVSTVRLQSDLKIDPNVVKKSLFLPKFRFSSISLDITTREQKKKKKKRKNQKKEEVEAVNFTVSNLEDYYHFYQQMGLKICMLNIIKELRSIRNMELIVYLFIQCVRKYESSEIQESFQPIFFHKSQKRKENNNSNLDYSNSLSRSIFDQLLEEVRKTDQKILERKKKKDEMNKRLRSRKYEDYYLSDDDDDDEEEDGDKGNRNENVLKFKTCFALECFNLIKCGEDGILRKSQLLKICLPFIHHLNTYDPRLKCHTFEYHPDFKGYFDSLNIFSNKNNSKSYYSAISSFFSFSSSAAKKDDDDDDDDDSFDNTSEDSDVLFFKSMEKFKKIPRSTFNETLKRIYESKEFWNFEVISNDGEKFKCHLEVLLLKSPYFNEMIIKNEVKKKNITSIICRSIKCSQLNKVEVGILLEFIYTNKITERTVSSAEKLKYILKMMIFAMLFKDPFLSNRCYQFLFKYFRKRRKSDFESFLVDYGHLLEDENLQTRFIREMGTGIVFKDGNNIMDDTFCEDQLQKSIRKFKVDSVLKTLKKECGVVEKENETLRKEKKSLLKRLAKLEKSM